MKYQRRNSATRGQVCPHTMYTPDAREIENNILKWLSIVTETRDEVIPKVKLCYYIHARDSDYLKLLEITYRNILNKLYGTREDLDIINEVQRRLLEDKLRLYKEAWET